MLLKRETGDETDTRSFNTTTSIGRLTLNILLSFAQFEREVTAERIRDKVAASRKKGMWMGGVPPFGFRVENRMLLVDEEAAEHVRWVFARFTEIGSGTILAREVEAKGLRTSRGNRIDKKYLYRMLSNRAYIGEAVPEANDLTVGIMALVAQADRVAISRRTKEALAVAKARGVKLGSPTGAASLRRAGKGGTALRAAASANAAVFLADLAPVLAAKAG